MTFICLFYFSLLLTSILVIEVRKPAPPETRFFLKNATLNSSSNHQQVVFFTDSSSTEPEILCLDEIHLQRGDWNLLVHRLCKDEGFATASNTEFLAQSHLTDYQFLSNISSIISCSQNEYFEIMCDRSVVKSVSCNFLHVECGPCHHMYKLKPNSSIQISSPLYPILQPGLVCQYDLHLLSNQNSEISIEINDLSLPVGKPTSDGHQCVSSFLHVLSGDAKSLKSVVTLCGDVRYPFKSSTVNLGFTSFVKILLVTGSARKMHGRRGLLTTVKASPYIKSSSNFYLILLGSILGFFLLLGVVFVILLWFARRRYRKRRKAIMNGSSEFMTIYRNLKPGESLHRNRTDALRRELGMSPVNWEENTEAGLRRKFGWSPLRQKRSLPSLPNLSVEETKVHQEQNYKDDCNVLGFKIYESIESITAGGDVKPTVCGQKDHCIPGYSNITEDTLSSPLYLELNREENSAFEDSCGFIKRSPVTSRYCIAGNEEKSHSVEVPRASIHLSNIMRRIRSISMTEPTEDEADLLGDVSTDKDDVFIF